MNEKLTQKEQEFAKNLRQQIVGDMELDLVDSVLEAAIKEIVKMAQTGLSEREILQKLKADQQLGTNVTRSLSGALAIARMERCMEAK